MIPTPSPPSGLLSKMIAGWSSRKRRRFSAKLSRAPRNHSGTPSMGACSSTIYHHTHTPSVTTTATTDPTGPYDVIGSRVDNVAVLPDRAPKRSDILHRPPPQLLVPLHHDPVSPRYSPPKVAHLALRDGARGRTPQPLAATGTVHNLHRHFLHHKAHPAANNKQ